MVSGERQYQDEIEKLNDDVIMLNLCIKGLLKRQNELVGVCKAFLLEFGPGCSQQLFDRAQSLIREVEHDQ